MGIEVLVNYFYRRFLCFGPKTGILLYVSSERVVAKKLYRHTKDAQQRVDCTTKNRFEKC